jgi:hypothetical protein
MIYEPCSLELILSDSAMGMENTARQEFVKSKV